VLCSSAIPKMRIHPYFCPPNTAFTGWTKPARMSDHPNWCDKHFLL
jgi:hypothetical protein